MRGSRLVVVALLAGEILMPVTGRCESGEAVFRARCARCHGATGTTDTPMARPLKVMPLVHDERLARMTPAEIVQLVKSDPKHRGVVHVKDADLALAARFVKALAQRPNPECTRGD